MIAHTRVSVAPGGRVTELACQPPLTVRQVYAEDAQLAALCLVGSAAGPLPGDRLALDLVVEPGARASLIATGATLAQGRARVAQATLRITVTVGVGGCLDADPGPLIVADGSDVEVDLSVRLHGDAALRWREIAVLGRERDAEPGAATITWNITRDDRPVLRQRLELRDRSRLRTAARRVLATEYRSAPGRTAVAGPLAVAQQLADGSMLATVLAEDAASAVRQLDALR